jgi:hypothetical protein
VGVKLRSLLILREEHIQRVFKNRVMKKIFGDQKDVSGGGKKMLNESLIIFTPCQIISG